MLKVKLSVHIREMLINLVVIVSIVLNLYSRDTMQITDVVRSLPVKVFYREVKEGILKTYPNWLCNKHFFVLHSCTNYIISNQHFFIIKVKSYTPTNMHLAYERRRAAKLSPKGTVLSAYTEIDH